ncbi:MAG: hypothetical protein ACRELS_18525 [Candidatus Rokuibacteriota bacterium]
MTRTLLVTPATRGWGEYRRRWVRALYRRHIELLQRALSRATVDLAATDEVTLLAAREFVDPSALPERVAVRYLDEEALRVDQSVRRGVTQRLNEEAWRGWQGEPGLTYRSVWLPDLLTQVRGTVFWLEISEPFAIARHVLDEVRPDRVVLLSGTTTLERVAGLLATRRGIAAERAGRRLLFADLYARFHRVLQWREERRRLREFLDMARPATAPACDGSQPILFVTCRARHHYVVDPVIESVRPLGVPAHVITAPVRDGELDARADALRERGNRVSRLSDFLPRDEARALVRRYRPVFRRLWRRIASSPDLGSRLTYEGVPLFDIARPLLRDSVERTLLVALLHCEAARRALDAIQPRAVLITSNRRYTERALAITARARGIPTLLFSGALITPRDDYRFYDQVDRILVAGDYLKDDIVDRETLDPRLVAVAGDPRSNVARMIPRERLRADVCRAFGFEPSRPIVVALSKYVSRIFSTREKEAYYSSFSGALALLREFQMLVKVHPNEDLPLLSEQVARWEWPDAVLTKDYDIHRLFAAADVAVMVTSMGGLEAMSLGCPVVAVQEPGKDYEGDGMPAYVSSGAAQRVDLGDSHGLAAALRRLVEDPDERARWVERGRAFAARYVHPADGRLGERLLATIEDVRRRCVAGRP